MSEWLRRALETVLTLRRRSLARSFKVKPIRRNSTREGAGRMNGRRAQAKSGAKHRSFIRKRARAMFHEKRSYKNEKGGEPGLLASPSFPLAGEPDKPDGGWLTGRVLACLI